MQTLAFALVAAALYGTALVTTHFALRHMNALAGARVSVPSACLLFWLLAPFQDLTGWETTAVAIFAVVGMFYPAAVTLLTFAANRRLGPNVAGTIGSTTPLFAVLGASLLLGEALGARQLAATGFIVAGTIALSNPGGAVAGQRPRAALWLPWSAAVVRALAQVVSKAGLLLWASPFAAVLIGYSVSTVVVWAAGPLGPRGAASAFNIRGAAGFAVTGVVNGGALYATYCALATGPVQVVAPIVATYPLFTLALSALFLRRELHGRKLVAGVLLTVAGVVMLLAG